jgi:hypothetical protein
MFRGSHSWTNITAPSLSLAWSSRASRSAGTSASPRLKKRPISFTDRPPPSCASRPSPSAFRPAIRASSGHDIAPVEAVFALELGQPRTSVCSACPPSQIGMDAESETLVDSALVAPRIEVAGADLAFAAMLARRVNAQEAGPPAQPLQERLAPLPFVGAMRVLDPGLKGAASCIKTARHRQGRCRTPPAAGARCCEPACRPSP